MLMILILLKGHRACPRWIDLHPPDAIRLRAPIRMASGRQKSPQMPFVFELQYEWHLEGSLGSLWGGFGEVLALEVAWR